MLQELSFVVIDLETTGGDHNADQIIEIGLVKIENLKIVDELRYLINPERPIPPFVQNLTSIFSKDLIHAPKIQEVIDKVLDFMGNSIIVAHNLSFDLPFFNSSFTTPRTPNTFQPLSLYPFNEPIPYP